jgi:hypothetical protein
VTRGFESFLDVARGASWEGVLPILTDSMAHNQVAKDVEEDPRFRTDRTIDSDVARLVERPPFSLLRRKAVLDGLWWQGSATTISEWYRIVREPSNGGEEKTKVMMIRMEAKEAKVAKVLYVQAPGRTRWR